MGRNSKSRKVLTRSESGTCNVCAAPCSSCMHINKASNTVKPEESFGETSQENIGSQISVTNVPVKLSACDSGLHAASETSNANSNCDIYHRDGESNACLKNRDVCRVSDKVEKPLTASPGRNIEQLCDKKAVKVMYEERKGTSGREDSTSCVTGGGEANRSANSNNKAVELRPSRDDLSSPNDEKAENSCSEEKKESGRLSKLPNSVKPLSGNANSKDLKENLGSKELVNLSMKESASVLCTGEEAIDHSVQDGGHSMAIKEACLKTKEETDTGNIVALEKASLELESETQEKTGTENQPQKVDGSPVHNNEHEKVESCELAGLQESNMESQPMFDAGESDVLEQDVKVCDICGDAGREDLLAICSRCSDGAEHTYCMWVMIDKVPEGDWLCEECKSLDEIKLKAAVVDVAVIDKDQSSEVDNVEDTNLILNVERKDLDAKGTKAKKNSLGKRDIDERPAEDVETPRVAKKQALGSSTAESLKSPRRVESLSRDSSFKKLHKGTLSKSSSFSTNPKARVEFFSEVPQKKKSARESTYVDREGTSKFVGRSASFKPSSLSRLSHSESNAKNLSPKFSHPQDAKESRQAKTQNILERKSSFKHDRLLVNKTASSSTVSTLNADQKLTPTDPFVSNSSEPKGVPFDSKPNKLLKPTSYTSRKGETKISSVSEYKPKDAGIKNDSSSSNYVAEKRFASKGDLPGVLSRSQDTDSPGERMKESSVVRSRTKIDSPRNMVNDANAARSSADVIKGNKLKAAIEAAKLKRPAICRKSKPADQADEVSMPSTNLNCETRPEDHLLTSNKSRNISSAHEVHEEQATSNNGDQSSLPLLAASLKSGDSCSTVPSGVSNQPSAMMAMIPPVLPEYEYIWQGGFDIRKIGKPADLRDGLQAHLSTFASPNVPEVANKFPSKLLLNEVPRVSTWPVQFHEAGAKEDNIALYFFAKDLESYERSYKVLVETMMNRDLALKGNFDGVDLLIFPSNHLPQNAQRWNMMYFLWGVFRRKKVRCVQSLPDSNDCNTSQAPECSATINLHGISRNVNAASNHSASLVLESHRSENVRGEHNTKVFSGNSNCQNLQENMERQGVRGDAKKCTGISAPETNDTTITLEGNVDPETKSRPDMTKVQPCVHDSKTSLAETNPSSVEQNPSSSKTSARASLSNDLVTLKRTVKEEEEPMTTSLVGEGNMMVYRTTEEPNEMQFSHGKRRHEGPTLEAPGASIDSSLASTLFSQGANKKQKTDSAGIELAGNSLFLEKVPNYGHSLEEETKAPKRGIALDLNETQDYTPDSPSPADQQDKGGLFDLNVAQDFPPDKDDEGGSSLLSLSLSFPSFNKEPEAKPMPKKEPVVLGRPNTRSSSLLFFDGLSKK